MSKVTKEDTVKVHYTGKLENGQVFDSSENREPLEFKMGAGQLIHGFEKEVMGMEEGESKEFVLDSSDAYGPYRKDLVSEISKEYLPKDLDPKVGTQLVSKTQDGKEFPVFIKELKEESVVIDANHPLAGENLTFDIKVVEVK